MQDETKAGESGYGTINFMLDMDYRPVSDLIPEQYQVGGRQTVGRTEESSIPVEMWNQIIDQDYRDDYAKKYFISKYFTVEIYEIRRNLSIAIASNQSYERTMEISNNSTIRRETNKTILIENTITADGSVKESASLTDELRTSYEISELNEYCSESEKRVTETFTYDAVDYDRTIVLWDVVKVIALYRTDRKRNTELVGIGDYMILEEKKTYAINGEAICEENAYEDLEYANCQND